MTLSMSDTRQRPSSRTYAGIGSRETPADVLQLMYELGAWLARQGYTLRSGGAEGADSAFEQGALSVAGARAEIFTPMDATPEALRLASEIHPNWNACTSYARKLHARNCFQVLGRTLDDPVTFVVCWTRGGQPVGGTATAIRLAERNGIPIFNLARPQDRARIEAKLQATLA